MYIWLYWENLPGKVIPPYIELCHETIRHYCGDDFEIVLTTDKTIRDYIPEAGPFEDIVNPNPAIRADFIRVHLLQKYGGIWLDSDIVLLQNFASMKPLIKEHGFVGFHKNSAGDNHVPVWIMMTEPEGKVITEYRQRLHDTLQSGRRRFGWSQLGAGMITPIIRNWACVADYKLLPEVLVSPVPWQRFRLVHQQLEPARFLTEDTMAFMLFNNKYSEEFKTQSKEEILASDTLVAKLLRLSLGI